MDLINSTPHQGLALCFESVNHSCVRFIHPTEIQILLYLIFSGVALITVCGNLLVIIAILHFKQLHTPTNYLLLSLAVSDLLVGGVVMPPSMLRSIETCWYLGDLFCKIHSSVDIMLCITSLLHISFIAIDRYYAVCQPLQYRNKITPPVSFIMICLSWGLAAFVGFSMVFLQLNIMGSEDFYYENIACMGACVIFQTPVASTLSSFLAFVLPALIAVCIYIKILVVARKQSKSIHNSAPVTKKINQSVPQTKEKATKTLAIIMGVFFLSISPFFFCNLVDPFLDHTVPPAVFDVLLWIGYFNSLCNPFVYAFFYRWFRKALRIIVLAKIFQANSSQLDLMGRTD